jgi:uncharacterized protein (DUF169 family)
MNLETCRTGGAELYQRLHLPTYPVSITYIQSEEEIPEKTLRPSSGGQKWSLCQAFTYARRWGRHSAMTEKDNFCVPASAMHHWIDVSGEDFIESQVRQGWHRDRAAERNRYAYNSRVYEGPGGRELLEKARRYVGMVCSPLPETLLEPDTVLVFGDGGHVTHIIHALCYEYTAPVVSSFEGFGESCAKGGLLPFLTGSPQVVLPGMGDRSFGGIMEGEIGIGFPASMLGKVVENLFKSGGRQNMGLPQKIVLPMGLTESLTPGFVYLRKKADGGKSGTRG